MAERFKRLYKLPENLYIDGSPIIISGGVLLNDTKSGNVVAQLKFHSVIQKIIKAVKISLLCYDVSGEEIKGVIDYQYLDLCIRNGQKFGSNKAIMLPSTVARSFVLSNIVVVFSDGNQWKCDDASKLANLPNPKHLCTMLNSDELEDQYRISTTPSAAYVPSEIMSIWNCACGEWNVATKCTKCGTMKQVVFSSLNIDELKTNAEKRIADEQAKKEKNERLAEIAKQEKEKQLEKQKQQHKKVANRVKIILATTLPIIMLLLTFSLWIYPNVIIPYNNYNKAEELLANKHFNEAIDIFESLDNYKDSKQRLQEINNYLLNEKYNKALGLYESGKYHQAISVFEELQDYQDSSLMIDKVYETMYAQAEELFKSGEYEESARMFAATGDYKDGLSRCWDIRISHCYHGKLSTGGRHTVLLNSDGTANAIGHWVHNQLQVDEWKNLKSIYTGNDQTFGITQSGKIYAVGNNSTGQCAVPSWDNIIMIDGGFTHTVGLKSNGKVRATGENEDAQCEVNAWSNIVSIACDGSHTVGLQADGTVVATGNNRYGQCDINKWTDIVAIDCNNSHTVGLRSDGTVVATGDNEFGQCDVSEWTDIIAIAAGWQFTIGLKANGEVVSTGWNEFGQCNVENWKDVVAISCGSYHAVALKSDGQIIATGKNDDGQCDVSQWDYSWIS